MSNQEHIVKHLLKATVIEKDGLKSFSFFTNKNIHTTEEILEVKEKRAKEKTTPRQIRHKKIKALKDILAKNSSLEKQELLTLINKELEEINSYFSMMKAKKVKPKYDVSLIKQFDKRTLELAKKWVRKYV